MRLAGDDGRLLQIERSECGPPGTPGDGDLLLNVSVRVFGYSASDQSWVVEQAWVGFLSQLRVLERQRRGQAELVGASPDDLRLTFTVSDAAGHMSVSGHLGWQTPDGFKQRMEFGFSFDPGLLATVLREFEVLGR